MHANKNRRNCNSASAISLDAPKHRLATARIIHTFFELSNYSRRERGSSASRKLSPRKLNARMINICAMRTHWSIHVRYQLHHRHLADCRILCKIISAQCGIWKLAKELIGMPNQLELLQEKVETAATPREKIDALNLLAYELRDVDGKHSLDLAQTALNLAQAAQDQKGIADSLANTSHCHARFAQYVLANSQGLQALALYEQLNDRAGQADTLVTLSWAQENLDNYLEAVELARRARKLAQEIDDRTLEALALNRLGNNYKRTNNYELAIAVYGEALALNRARGDEANQGIVLANLALTYLANKQYDQAFDYALVCMRLEGALEVSKGFAHNVFGGVHKGRKKYAQALESYQAALTIANKTGMDRLALAMLETIGEIYVRLEQFESAIQILTQGLHLAEKTNIKYNLFKCHQFLAEIYERQGDLAQALAHYKQYHTVKESLFNDQNAARLQVLETQHHTEIARREAEIYQLRNVALEQEIAERKQVEEALRESEARFESYFRMPLAGVAMTSPEKGWLEVNSRVCEMLGYTTHELMGMTWVALTHPEDVDADVAQFNQIIAGAIESFTLVKRFIHKNRHIVWTEMSVGCVRKPDGAVDYLVVMLQDITERKRLEVELERRATTDVLTGIANRRHFLEIAQRELQRAQRFHHAVSIALIDLDHFKQINDTYGHAVGDQALIALTRFCQTHTREIDLLARFGGDEFALLMPETNRERAHQVVERIRLTLTAQPIAIDRQPILLTLSAGIATWASQEDNLDAVIARADQALYRAKQAGRNRVVAESAGS
jgi:diguanylate cyclase (GGDEF)-like protein/PAS domain S-box-containing protein